jgi:hypothetical protein
MSELKVLAIPVSSIEDLVRLVVVIRDRSSILISFPATKEGRYVSGSYLNPVGESISATFPYVVLDEKPKSILGFTSDYEGRERLVEGPYSSSNFAPIPVSYLQGKPHREIDPGQVRCTFSRVPAEDLLSLVKLAVSTASEDAVPFLWYDHSRSSYALSVSTKGSNDLGEGLMMIDWASPPPRKDQKYVSYRLNDGREEVTFTPGMNDYSAHFTAVINVKELPYYDLKVE